MQDVPDDNNDLIPDLEEPEETGEPGQIPQQQSKNPKQLLPPQLINRTLNDQEFEDFYLQQITQEFGDDLDKLRQSKDFNDNSLVMLIDALKQGVNIFDQEQRAVILNHNS
jgi:hypothetical protein